MQRLIVILLAIACSGCATDIANSSETKAPGNILLIQNSAINPLNGGQLTRIDSLQMGDIILSSASGIMSAGIQLITLAPVSHAALYIGDQQVVEAVGAGVRVRAINEMLAEESVVVAFRDPRLTSVQGDKIREFALGKVGGSYNHVGVMLQAPFALERRVCELPLIPAAVRDFCLRGVATVQLGVSRNDRFFCSQLVLEAYRHAGLPITDADPRWISPADILHMRQGDVPSMKIHQALVYLGHLKYAMSSSAGDGIPAPVAIR